MAIVTVSRQYGTGGIQMARKLAERIGARFIFRDELIQSLSARGLEIDLERIEGRPPSLFERLFRVNRETLRENLRAVMAEEADKPGDLVIGGWGAQIFLKDRKDTLHVRVIGPNESRIRYLMDTSGVTRSGAEDIIKRIDRDQSLFSQHFFETDFANPKLYHVVLNIDQLSHENMIDILIEMLPLIGTPAS